MAAPVEPLAVLRFDLQTVLAHQAAAANEARPKLVDLDAFGNDRHVGRSTTYFSGREKIVLCLSVCPATIFRAADDLAVLVDVLHELRDVIQDVEIAHVGPHPAPHLHVGAQPFGGRR